MQGFAGLAVALLIGCSVFVGLRLLAVHRRTGGSPELMLGLMLLLSVGVGYPCSIMSLRAADLATARILNIVSALAVNGGYCLLYLFAARVFRPDSAWARVLSR